MNITTIGWVLFGLGFIPWRIHQQSGKRKERPEKERTGRSDAWRSLLIQATFWRVTIVNDCNGLRWHLHVPLITRLKAAIWSAVREVMGVAD